MLRLPFFILSFLLGWSLLLAQETEQSYPPLFNSAEAYNAAEQYRQREAYDSAIALLEKIHPGDSIYNAALYELGRCYYLLDSNQTTIAIARKAIEEERGYRASFLNLLASAYADEDEFDQALEIYNQALARYPSDYQLYFSRGRLLDRLDRDDEAVQDWYQAIELNPYHFASHFNLAVSAFHEQKFTQALMALGYAVMINPTADGVNPFLVAFDQAVSDDFAFEPSGVELEIDENYRRTDLLIKSFVALREDYDYDYPVRFPLARQMHLAYHQIAERKTGNGFWENYYQPFYEALIEDDQFEALTYLLVASSGSEYHQQLREKKAEEINDFVAWAVGKLREIHNEHHRGYDPDAPVVNFFYHEGSTRLSAVGEVNKKGMAQGPFVFFHPNGSKASEGIYDNGNREGQWIFYHDNGDTSRVTIYADDLPQGPSREYHDNGRIFFTANYVDGEFDGPSRLYNRYGILTRLMHFDAGKLSDTLSYYYANGQVSGKVPHSDGLALGKAIYFHEEGSLASRIEFAEDQRDGKAVFFHPNGQEKARTGYLEGELHGDYLSYYPNGQMEAKGAYQEGIKSGTWKTYNPLGVLRTEESFDEKGKQTGRSIEYDDSGRKKSEMTYKGGEITAYTIYNRQGEILAQEKEKWGKFYFENFNLYGQKIAEGHYHGDHKEGEWKYYDGYGRLQTLEKYNEEGQLHGETRLYWGNGQLKARYLYDEGQRQGYYVEYFDHGTMSEEGWYVDDQRQGEVREYDFNGNLITSSFYLDNEINGPQKTYSEEGLLEMIKFFDRGVLYQTESWLGDTMHHRETFSGAREPDIALYPNGQERYHIESAGNLYDGQATWYYGSGAIETKGAFLNGNRYGNWQWFYPNGQLRQNGSYSLTQAIGEWKDYHENGQLEEQKQYLNGEVHGPYVEYHEDGSLREKGHYYLGSLHGARHFYSPSGVLNHIRYYDHGRIVGYASRLSASGTALDSVGIPNGTAEVKSYYPDGQLARSYRLEKGYLEGEYLEYNPDGSLAYQGQYKDNNRMGTIRSYDGEGNLIREETRVEGYLEGLTTEYYSNGQVRRKIPYRSGRINGIATEYNEDGQEANRYRYVGDDLYEVL